MTEGKDRGSRGKVKNIFQDASVGVLKVQTAIHLQPPKLATDHGIDACGQYAVVTYALICDAPSPFATIYSGEVFEVRVQTAGGAIVRPFRLAFQGRPGSNLTGDRSPQLKWPISANAPRMPVVTPSRVHSAA